MNDKTEQSAPNEPRGTAAGGHAVIINVPGCPLMVRAVDYNTLYAQLAEAQRDAEQLREAAGRVPPKRQDDAPLEFDDAFDENLWDERDE